ncbi:YdcF family protein [Prosthecochloris sp. CIB 2401]|uniref:YdcF family protein n=1 Tax=Prosthecochloris sp. CIB 2401 TaxID=1868325 RepID=UPI00083B20DA|nr:YdcF family protein [Prosthecochloris sp. CIB 2401]
MKRAILILCTASMALLIGMFLSLGVLVSGYHHPPRNADVIVILGGDQGRRLETGIQLYKKGYASNIILTGIDRRYYNPDTPNWRERRLKEHSIPDRNVIVDLQSRTTWDEARNTLTAMQANGWKKALVISDPPHMLRLHHTWNRIFADSDHEFILVATRPEWWEPLTWWQNNLSRKYVLNEIRKNIYYALIYY